jgi:hypothetical protein
MDSFVKKIFSGVNDNFVHLQFQRFSKGEFKDKALMNINKSKEAYSITSTYEYANEFVRSVADKMKEGQKTNVTGVIVSTRNLKALPEFSKLLANAEVKQFMGVKQFKINTEMSKNEIIQLCDILPNSFLGLSFSVNGTDLKIKAKAPKSAKPSTGDKRPKPDFCKIKTADISLVKEVVFDFSDFKKAEISYDFIIKEIIIPKNEKDPAKMREMAVKKGKIIRRTVIDGKESISESNFEA